MKIAFIQLSRCFNGSLTFPASKPVSLKCRCVLQVDLVGSERVNDSMGFSMFFVGLGCLMGPPLAGEWATGNEKQNNLGYVAKTTFQMCAIKDMCAAYSSFCVRAHWRSLKNYVFWKHHKSALFSWVAELLMMCLYVFSLWKCELQIL